MEKNSFLTLGPKAAYDFGREKMKSGYWNHKTFRRAMELWEQENRKVVMEGVNYGYREN